MKFGLGSGDWPVSTMIDAGLSADTADTLLSKLTDTSAIGQRALLRNAMRAAKTKSDLVVKTTKKTSLHLDPDIAAAFCKAASLHDNSQIRSALADLLGKESWTDGLPLLGYLIVDEDDKVKKHAKWSLNKLNNPLWRVLTKHAAPGMPDIATIILDDANSPYVTFDTPGGGTVALPGSHDAPAVPDLEGGGGLGGQTAAGAPDQTSNTGGGVAAPGALPAATIRRFTQLDYAPHAEQPHSGDLTLSFKMEKPTASSAAVDLRVREGKQFASLIVHASSESFKVSPEIQTIKVPRKGDSEPARIAIEASRETTGDVLLTIFDETRLVGSLAIKMKAEVKNDALTLRKLQAEVFRDPASSALAPGFGLTVQASLPGGTDGRINFHALFANKSGAIELIPIGSSPQGLQTGNLQIALTAFRDQIAAIADNLANPGSIAAMSRDDALKALELKFNGLGQLIFRDYLSLELQSILNNRSPETTVHWVVKDSVLDAIPWELAFQKFDNSPVSEPPLLIRVPVWTKTAELNPPRAEDSAKDLKTIAYVLGTEVINVPPGTKWGAERVKSLLDVLAKASTAKFALKQNFSDAGLDPFSITSLCPFVEDARIIHMLCHGIGSPTDFYLQLQAQALGQIRPVDINAWRLPARPLVFVNACSSGASTFSGVGFTSFGKSFLEAGASVYIGTLATVVTESALKFATEFFNACLGEGLGIAAAMNRVRKTMAKGPDPSWRLYSIYGDLQATDTLFK